MQYAIKAVRKQQSATLRVDAVDVQDATRQAQQQGYSVIAVRAQRSAPFSFGRRAEFPLLQFNQSLLILLQAGLSVVESIETLAEREMRADIKQVLRRVTAELMNGLPLSTALERQPEVFPAIYVASVRANERTGALIEAVERFIVYRSQADLLRKRIVSAAIYPSMILAVGALVIAFLLLYVVPRFSQVFQDMGDRIPAMSRLLLDWGSFVHAHGVEVAIAMVVGVFAVGHALSRKRVQAAIGQWVQRLPRIGEYVRTYQLARFYRALGMLQRAGIPIVAALDMSFGLLPAGLHAALAAARRDIVQGQAISNAFEHNGLTTAVSLRLLRVGERTGQMGEMLERSATFHDEDIAQAIDWFIRLFEPLLMIVIGIVIGVVVLLMYAPIFELAGSLQ